MRCIAAAGQQSSDLLTRARAYRRARIGVGTLVVVNVDSRAASRRARRPRVAFFFGRLWLSPRRL